MVVSLGVPISRDFTVLLKERTKSEYQSVLVKLTDLPHTKRGV